MAIIIQKFGGSSVADIEKINNVARIVQSEVKKKNQVVVVVSAMQGETDRLLGLANQILHPITSEAMSEYDVIASSGEQISAGLLALALQKIKIPAISMLGWQIKLNTTNDHTKGRIIKCSNIKLIQKHLKDKKVVVVAGFQGVTKNHRITTLGRGGSDTSAVAIGIAMNAKRCDIYKDVDGIFTTDPRICKEAKKIDKISIEEMLELSSTGSKVLQVRAVELAMKYNIDICVRPTFNVKNTGTILVSNDQKTKKIVTGISCSANENMINIYKIENSIKFYTELFNEFKTNKIDIDMIIQNEDNEMSEMTFLANKIDLINIELILKKIKKIAKFDKMTVNENIAKISIVGAKMKNESGILSKTLLALMKNNIDQLAISTSDIKISIVVNEKEKENVVKILHKAFNL